MAAEARYLDDDIIRIPLYKSDPAGNPVGDKLKKATLFWGDQVRITGKQNGQHLAEFSQREWSDEEGRYKTVKYVGVLPKKATFRDDPILKVRFVDVGQGDGAMVETPKGQILLIDGGEEAHVRRYINVAYSHILRTKPLPCYAIIVTHGDADHFAGLTDLVKGTRSSNGSPMVTAENVFHNGLVKASYDKDTEAFGKTAEADGRTYAVELEDDLTKVADERMNEPFREWKEALQGLKNKDGQKPHIQRLEYGDDKPFKPLEESEGIKINVLGPIVEEVRGKPALRFLRTPGSRSLSASHTVNGHSVVLKLTYGNVRFLFGADLNEESEESLLERARADGVSLSAEVLKVPHHGSADFSPRILESIRPVASVVSSGDENSLKEYIHPRSGLMGALGRYSRATVDKPLIFVTEMVAFFQRLGRVKARKVTPKGGDGKELNDGFPLNNVYQKTIFGIVHVRTDGERVLVATHSGKDDQKESYSFHVDERGDIKFEEKPSII